MSGYQKESGTQNNQLHVPSSEQSHQIEQKRVEAVDINRSILSCHFVRYPASSSMKWFEMKSMEPIFEQQSVGFCVTPWKGSSDKRRCIILNARNFVSSYDNHTALSRKLMLSPGNSDTAWLP
ncbi:hypothetical protein YC2023_059899 [Brassica napus]